MGPRQALGAAHPRSNPDTLTASCVTSVNLLDSYSTLLFWKMASIIFTLKGGYEG